MQLIYKFSQIYPKYKKINTNIFRIFNDTHLNSMNIITPLPVN